MPAPGFDTARRNGGAGPPALELGGTPGYLIRRAQRVHTTIWSQLVGAEPTGPQFAVLSVLARTPGVDQRAVGVAASLDKSTTADIVRRLVRNNWLTVTADQADRRRKLLTLTRPAAAALADLTRTAAAVQVELLRPLPAASAHRLVDQLALLAYDGHPPAVSSELTGLSPNGESGPTGLDLRTTPGHLIRRAQQAHAVNWTNRFNGELTSPQYAVLCTLAVHDGVDQATVGDVAALDKSSVAQVVQRLIARNMVTAAADPRDRRRKQLRLCADVSTEMAGMTAIAKDVDAQLLHFIAPGDRAEFLSDLAAVARFSA